MTEPDNRIEIMAPAVRHFCKTGAPNTGIWCNADRSQPIQRLYTYTYTCLRCGERFTIRVQRVFPDSQNP